jgi:hypothetical protein
MLPVFSDRGKQTARRETVPAACSSLVHLTRKIPAPAVAQISFRAANPILEQGNRCFF